jgi:hypothetical protein
MTEPNLIEFRSDGSQEVGDFEANRDDPGTLDVGRQGHWGYRRADINRGLPEPQNKQVQTTPCGKPCSTHTVENICEGFSDCPLLSGWLHGNSLVLQESSSFNFKRCKAYGHTSYTVRYLTALCNKRGTHRQALLRSMSIRRLSFCREPRANKRSNHNWIVGLNRLFLVCMTPAYIPVLLSNQHYVGVVGLPRQTTSEVRNRARVSCSTKI